MGEEKRKFERWNLENENTQFDYKGRKEEMRILDISVRGMKILTNSPLEKFTSINCEFRILPNTAPFFVKGKVIWTAPKDSGFESGIEFEKVSTIPLNVI
ncbi:MAG: PilZ domain-containing protein [Candidatus Omnitrophica bacterium]|nr:PilZ domain-containing protein [Candidatus Omnitrophota bacterium]